MKRPTGHRAGPVGRRLQATGAHDRPTGTPVSRPSARPPGRRQLPAHAARDQVEFNLALQAGQDLTFTLTKRRGRRVAVFEAQDSTNP